jgi:hypothetical protein
MGVQPPSIPAELLSQFGEPEDIFGPNFKVPIIAAVCGVILLITSLVFFLLGLAGVSVVGLARTTMAAAAPLAASGFFALQGIRHFPLHWLFVCPNGLVRRRENAWDTLSWADVERFEDATVRHKMVTVRQCRIVTTSGAEWGFLAHRWAEYDRLSEVLQRKIDEWPKVVS